MDRRREIRPLHIRSSGSRGSHEALWRQPLRHHKSAQVYAARQAATTRHEQRRPRTIPLQWPRKIPENQLGKRTWGKPNPPPTKPPRRIRKNPECSLLISGIDPRSRHRFGGSDETGLRISPVASQEPPAVIPATIAEPPLEEWRIRTG